MSSGRRRLLRCWAWLGGAVDARWEASIPRSPALRRTVRHELWTWALIVVHSEAVLELMLGRTFLFPMPLAADPKGRWV